MQTLETLRTQINCIEDLRSVVRTMKALSMVSIRQYEKARTSLSDYNHTVELGLQALLHHRHFSETPAELLPLTPPPHPMPNPSREVEVSPRSNLHFPNSSRVRRIGVIVFGSDHGLCGQFNEHLVTYALNQLEHRQIYPDQCLIAAVGARLIPYLEAAQHPIEKQFSLPSSLAGTPRLIQELLLTIDQWRFRQNPPSIAPPFGESPDLPHPQVEQILLFHHRSQSTSSYAPLTLQLLPLDRTWLHHLEQRPWNSPSRPSLSLNWEQLFSALVRQYLFVSLYRAAIESLASENASRLVSMQAAEKNIDDRLSDLNAQYRQQRQNSITGELLDIVAGFEALNQPRSGS